MSSDLPIVLAKSSSAHYFSLMTIFASDRAAHRRRRALLVAPVAALLVVSGCSSSIHAKRAVAIVGKVAAKATASATFTAFGSIGQATVLDAPKAAALTLVDSAEREVASGQSDDHGSLVFYDVKPGDGYTVRHSSGAAVEGTKPFRILDRNDAPTVDNYGAQHLVAGLNYVKVRDGIELAMTVRLPPGKAITDGPFPTVIEYSGYPVAPPHDLLEDVTKHLSNPNLPSDSLVPTTATAVGAILAPLVGFATVSVQIRGTGCSGGAFDLFGLPTIYDGYDAVETVAAQSWVHAHKVGMVGISFSGFSQLFVGGTRPPHLAALAPMSVTDDLYEGIGSPGGIFNTGFAKGWLTERQEDSKAAPEGGQRWAKTLVAEGDTHCIANQTLHRQARDGLSILAKQEFRDPKLYADRTPGTWAAKINVPTFLVGGLEDEQLSSHWADMLPSMSANKNLWVTMYNGNHNDALQPAILSRWVEFLDIFVADKVPEIPAGVLALAPLLYSQMANAPAPDLQQARFATMTDPAAARAEFSKDPRIRVLLDVGAGSLHGGALQPVGEATYDSWPPKQVAPTTYYLGEHGALQSSKIAGDAAGSAATADTYQSDPAARPPMSLASADGGKVNDAAPPYDWEPVVDGKGLGYSTGVLDADVVLAGPSSLDVYVSADGVDADLQATLSEVRADGKEMYLGSGWMRASHRKLDDAASTPLLPRPTHLERDAQALQSGSSVLVRILIFPTYAQVRKGSRLRITIQAPGGDRPAWTFRATADTAQHVTIAHDRAHPSALVLPVVVKATAKTPPFPCGVLRGEPCRTYAPATNGG